MKNKKIFIIFGIVFILIVLALIIYYAYFYFQDNFSTTNEEDYENLVQIIDDNTKVNISLKLAQPKQVDGLEITNLTLTESNNVTQLLGTITNTTSEEKGSYILNISFIDKEEMEMASMEFYVKNLQPGESTQLNASTIFDYANAYDVKITKK